MKIGFVGAGNIGQRLAHLGNTAGYNVCISNSRGPDSLREVANQLGVQAVSVEEAVVSSDLVVLTVPFSRLFDIDPEPFPGRLVLDTNNYYPTRDGRFPELDEHVTTTSELVQAHLRGAIVVKAFNAILAADLVPPFGLPGGRRALPVAADDREVLAPVTELHARVGFDMVWAGDLAESWRFERAKPAYCIPLDHDGLLVALGAAERDVELPHNSWKRDD
ncbi:MAG: NADP oxidoreductase [Microbacteriaceae bacterium]|nr:MAG: NADP oxidoreductase [Microbacteriaceae bacterium]